MNSFDIFKQMVLQKKDIKLCPLSNIEQLQTRASGIGYVKIAVPNETIMQILNGGVKGGLLICDAAQYDELERRLSNETI